MTATKLRDATDDKPTRHKCPNWCHLCPDMRAIALEREGGDVSRLNEFDVMMPACMGGVLAAIEGCYCWRPGTEPPPVVELTLDRRWFNQLVRLANDRNEKPMILARRLLIEGIMRTNGQLA